MTKEALTSLAETWQWDGDYLKEGAPDWVAECTEPAWSPIAIAGFTGGMVAHTSMGKLSLKKGDWLIRYQGEVHAIKPASYSALSSRDRRTT